MAALTEAHHERADLFAHECYDYFEEGIGDFDSRLVNEVVADIADDLAGVARPWDLTTTRFNEKIIRVDELDGTVHEHRSYELDLRAAAYDAAGLDRERFVEQIRGFVLGAAERLAENEVEVATGYWVADD